MQTYWRIIAKRNPSSSAVQAKNKRELMDRGLNPALSPLQKISPGQMFAAAYANPMKARCQSEYKGEMK